MAGVVNNVAFLRRVARTPSFAEAHLDTALIERERAALFGQPGLPLEVVAAGVVARALSLQARSVDADPWSRRDGWRMHGTSVQRFDLDWQGESLEVLLAVAAWRRRAAEGRRRGGGVLVARAGRRRATTSCWVARPTRGA